MSLSMTILKHEFWVDTHTVQCYWIRLAAADWLIAEAVVASGEGAAEDGAT